MAFVIPRCQLERGLLLGDSAASCTRSLQSLLFIRETADDLPPLEVLAVEMADAILGLLVGVHAHEGRPKRHLRVPVHYHLGGDDLSKPPKHDFESALRDILRQATNVDVGQAEKGLCAGNTGLRAGSSSSSAADVQAPHLVRGGLLVYAVGRDAGREAVHSYATATFRGWSSADSLGCRAWRACGLWISSRSSSGSRHVTEHVHWVLGSSVVSGAASGRPPLPVVVRGHLHGGVATVHHLTHAACLLLVLFVLWWGLGVSNDELPRLQLPRVQKLDSPLGFLLLPKLCKSISMGFICWGAHTHGYHVAAREDEQTEVCIGKLRWNSPQVHVVGGFDFRVAFPLFHPPAQRRGLSHPRGGSAVVFGFRVYRR
mmetsp:Transcript_36310/g.58308  ORF Transcript_36310/g.58308 Transcript_36310/m.58308 type:complete len:372 (+) Transcript_36310:51-1166(+)